jgi:uncharacterized protein YdbL (DUF1318 family)
MKQLLLSLLLFIPLAAFALDIDTAKSQGLIGEQPNGYLGLVVNNAEAKKLIDDINAKRKAQYAQIAERNNIDLHVVEKLAGEKTINKTKPGHFIFINGTWSKK